MRADRGEAARHRSGDAGGREPEHASRRKWLPVMIVTKLISSGHSAQNTRAARMRTSRASDQTSITAKATCIDGTAAYWLTK